MKHLYWKAKEAGNMKSKFIYFIHMAKYNRTLNCVNKTKYFKQNTHMHYTCIGNCFVA